MAYQNIRTPRFYIDTPSYLSSLGIEYGEGYNKDLFGLNPINQVLIEETPILYEININLPTKIGNLFDINKGYFGFLNHSISPKSLYDSFLMNLNANFSDVESVINFDSVNSEASTTIDSGFSLCLCKIDYSELESFQIRQITYLDNLQTPKSLYMGNLTFGSYYDMPVNPNLSLSMEIEYSGSKNLKTLNGSTITQSNYQGSPWWYDKDGIKVEPWSIGQSQGLSKRNGRRIWNLEFSYINDKDLFASNYGNNNYLETDTDYDSTDLDTDIDSNNIFYYNIDNDNSFSAQVLNKVSNGERFIFQPDNTANNPSDFAICVLDEDSFSMQRVAPNTYNIEMTIKEVW